MQGDFSDALFEVVGATGQGLSTNRRQIFITVEKCILCIEIFDKYTIVY